MKNIIKKIIKLFGYQITKLNKVGYPIDYDNDFIKEFEAIEPFTMTSIERIFALKSAVKYIVKNNISGSFVECGVWKGGSCMLIANTLAEYEQFDSELWLYDTFDGMTKPTDEDVEVETGIKGMDLVKNLDKNTDKFNMWAYAPKDLVIKNMRSTKYPEKKIKYIEAKVEQTLIKNKPAGIALLRLDTDWYESTKIELEALYPRLVSGGVLIIDDYGHFQGAKKAVDEYFKNINEEPLMHRIDYSGRMIIKR